MTPLIDRAREKLRSGDGLPPAPVPVPTDVQKRIDRGRKEMLRDAGRRRLCQLFLDGEQYFYEDDKGVLRNLETRRGIGSGKPTHRIRNRHNFIRPIVDAKVSSSTTRVPGYEVNPTTTDAEDVAAAALSQKIVRMGWKRWGLRDARVRTATLAVGGGGKGFALPYFDPNVGPFHPVTNDETGELEMVGEGEVKILVLNGNECYCEPGVRWEDSRWYCVETARPVSEVEQMPGYMAGVLEPDASTSQVPQDRPSDDMVMVTLFFERPCPRYPQGRMLTIAGGRQIMPQAEYPMMLGGQALDEPCIHRLVYRIDPRRDDDHGLTWELIDFQSSINDCKSKSLELKNLALLAQLMAPRGSIKVSPTDQPGDILYYDAVGGVKPEWRQPPDPSMLAQLREIEEALKADMRYVAADADVQAQPNVAADALGQVLQQAANRWSQFIEGFAEWDSAVARHCLLLCQRHYSEERVLRVRGRTGWEPEQAFRGADIAGQVDVTVLPASIETRSRAQQLQTLAWIQANFPGFIRPEAAIETALYGTSPDALIERFEADKARMNEIIQRLRNGTLLDMPTHQVVQQTTDPLTGAPVATMTEMPGWMPREFDDTDVQLWVLEGWLKTPEAAALDEGMLNAAMEIYRGLKHIQAAQQAEQQAALTEQAQDLGSQNAAKPQPPKPMPSTPSPGGQ